MNDVTRVTFLCLKSIVFTNYSAEDRFIYNSMKKGNLTCAGNSPKYAAVPPTILGDQIVSPFSSKIGKIIVGASHFNLDKFTNTKNK